MCLTKSIDSCAGYNQDNRVPLSTTHDQMGYMGWFWPMLMSTMVFASKERI